MQKYCIKLSTFYPHLCRVIHILSTFCIKLSTYRVCDLARVCKRSIDYVRILCYIVIVQAYACSRYLNSFVFGGDNVERVYCSKPYRICDDGSMFHRLHYHVLRDSF